MLITFFLWLGVRRAEAITDHPAEHGIDSFVVVAACADTAQETI